MTLADLTLEERGRVFDQLPLAEDVQDALHERGYSWPTPIQLLAIPLIERGCDLIAQAETGTGKTVAFSAPLISVIDGSRRAVQALVLTPTRELAQQVAEEMRWLGKGIDLQVSLVVGGVDSALQVQDIASGCQVVVGTPGRVLDFLGQGVLKLGWVEFAVLDEADRMLDMGFIEDVGKILDRLPRERQTLLFSATMPSACMTLAQRYMNAPCFVRTTQHRIATVSGIQQRYVELPFNRRLGFLMNLIRANPGLSMIIFCNTKKEVRFLDRELWGRGFEVHSLHGDHDQELRFKIIEAFRSGQCSVLVATDVASRGLDIEAVGLVINWDVPREVESYTHRIGRTGRAGRSGRVITMVTADSRRDFDEIRRRTGFDIRPIEPPTEANY
jgi:ATP-dependent RNA helicase DeaD